MMPTLKRSLFKRLTSLIVAAAAVIGLAERYVSGDEPQDISRQRDIVYGRKYGMALTMDCYTPAKPNGMGVLWFVSRGGASDHDWLEAPEFSDRLNPLLARGYTVFAVVHGSSPLFNLEDFVADARRAVRFTRHHAAERGIDSARLGACGASAGGYLALMLGTTGDDGKQDAPDPVEREPSKVQAVGTMFAPADWLNYGEAGTTILDRMQGAGANDPAFVLREFDKTQGIFVAVTDKARRTQWLKNYSPVTHASGDDAPTVLIHGDSDQNVPFQQAERMKEQLAKAGVPTKLISKQGKGHGW